MVEGKSAETDGQDSQSATDMEYMLRRGSP